MMDEIEFLIFRKLVETDQLEHVVRGWTVCLEFPEIDLSVTYVRGRATFVWGIKDERLADGVTAHGVAEVNCA